MNKPYFCRNFFLTDWRHKRLKYIIDLLLFYGEHFYGFSESDKRVASTTLDVIVYKKTDSGTSSDNKWKRMTTSDNEWQWLVQRVTTSGATSDKSDNE